MMKKELKTIEETQLSTAVPAPVKTMSPLEMMVQMKGMNLEPADMREMLTVQKEYEANEALKSFNLALAQFKSEEIMIGKDADVAYGTTAYSHATLGNIVSTAVPFMSKHGFSHRWRTEQSEGGLIKVTFILTHMSGHSEETSLQASPDASGGKNAIQSVASTVSYLERYTFLAGTGLAVSDQDNDAVMEVAMINADQLTVLDDLIEETKSDKTQFVKFLKVESLEFLPESKYKKAVEALQSKRTK